MALPSPEVKTDLVLVPFDASIGDMVAAAGAADAGGFDTVWTYDHFSGLVTGRAWSRDPFVALAAIASATSRVGVGILVANVANRHPAQLASAMNSLQSLAPGRVLLGVGGGTAASSPWSAESTAIGRPVPGPAQRRARLVETIQALKAIWRGEEFRGNHVVVAAAMAVTDGTAAPPIIVGASRDLTVDAACDHADGVNLLPEAELASSVARIRRRRPPPFDVSVFDRLVVDHPLGGDPEPLVTLGVDRRTLWVAAPYPLEAIRAIGANLA